METLYDMHCHLGFAENAASIEAAAKQAHIGALSCTVTPQEFARFGAGDRKPQTQHDVSGDTCRAEPGSRKPEGTVAEDAKEDLTARCRQRTNPDARQGIKACGNTPEKARIAKSSESCPSILWALGLHPWYVAEDWRAQVGTFEELLPNAAAFGELGLDFSVRHRATADAQAAAFERLLSVIVLEAARRAVPPLLSLHAVGSAGTVLELLRKSGALDVCAVVFHWFSGSGEELNAARAAGCYFSAGPHMLASRRGRAYGAQIPAEQLLLETDEPPEGAFMDAATWRGQLEGALNHLAQLRKADPGQLAATISATSRLLLCPSPFTKL